MNGSKFATKLSVFLVLITLVGLPVASRAAAPEGQHRPGQLHTVALPEVRVTAQVDNGVRSALHGHVPGALRRATDLGRIAPGTPAAHMVMVLQSSDAQRAELRRVLDEQQDSRTQNYHQWVTPEQFGDHFGVHDADIAKVTAWLTSQGFTVEDVARSKRLLHFSGTTGQIEKAFRTEMHSYQVNGESHVSNNSEISVPAALSPVIAGVSLHDFFRKAHLGPTKRLRDMIATPEYSSSGGTHYTGPFDFATIYNTLPLLSAGIDGTGTSIAVVGRSDIQLSDVQSYRQLFNLPVNDPIFIHAGQDNGVEPGDDGESYLDVEISGGIAPKAQVYFVIGTPTFLVDGITNSIQYIVENNLADIMSISYGSCEANGGTGGNQFNSQAFEQAAAQGISVFVSSGDNGPAGCDNSNDTFETYGYAVGSESSTPYSVSVGGTEFYEGSGTYWGATNSPLALNTALSYMPETPWNEAKGADKTSSTTLNGLWSGSGGISAYYLQPSWQRGPGVPTTDPTLVGGKWVTGVNFSSGGSGYTSAPTVTFTGGGCTGEPQATAVVSGGKVVGLSFVYYSSRGQGIGCTSAPTIAFSGGGGTGAAATAIIGPMQNPAPLITGIPHRFTPDLSLNAASGHDGTLYCAEGVCQFTTTAGVTSMSDAGIVGGTSVAAPSMAGIQALINQANGGRQGAPNYIYYALAAAQNTAACNSSTPPLPGAHCAFQDVTVGDNLICGTSTCTAATGTHIGFQAGVGYDLATGLGSVNAANLSSQWKNVVFNSTNTTLNLSQTAGIAQGSAITFSGSVAPGSGTGTPTGDVVFIVSQGAFGQTVDVNTGAWAGPTPVATLDGSGHFTATLGNLPGGSYNVTARYGGDETYASSLSAPVPVSVNSGNSTVTITPATINLLTCTMNSTSAYTYGGPAWIPVAVTGTSGKGVPTGTVTITVDGATWGTVPLDPSGNGYLIAGNYGTSTTSCLYDYIFSQGPFLQGGTHSIGASYSGDSTFTAAVATPVGVTVSPLSSTPTLTAGAQTISSGFSTPLTATFAAITALTSGAPTAASGPTGTVTFKDTTTNAVLGTATVVPVATFTGPGSSSSALPSYTYSATATATTNQITVAGANSITAVYSGDSNYASTTSSAVTVTVAASALTATTVAVTSNSNPTTLGGRPTFTATLTPSTVVSGTVTFFDGATALGTGSVGSGHTATLHLGATPAFVGGLHNITAIYGGNSTYGPSKSAALAETVTQGTTSIVLSGKLAGQSGQAFTFSAVITPNPNSGTYSPNLGVVQFFDGSVSIGAAAPIIVAQGQGGYGLWTAVLTVNNLSAGTHSITARYSDINYSLATSNAQTITVGGITWAAPAAITYGTALSATQLNATDSVPGSFVYTPGLGAVLGAGSQTLSTTFTPTDTGHFAVQTATVQLQVNKASQTITFAPPASPVTFGVSPITLSATATSGLAVSYGVTGPALLSGNTLTITGAGAVVVTANQAGNANYSAAAPVPQTIVVNPAPQTITFAQPVSPVVYGVLPITLSANSTSSLPVSFTATGPASVSGNTLTITGAGVVAVTANQVGTANYTAATPVTQSIVVNPAALTVTANNASRAVGAANPAFTASYTGFVNGDTTAAVSGAPAFSTTATTSSAAGVYPITIAKGTLAAANYTFTLVNGSLSVVAAPTVTLTTTATLTKVSGGYQATVTVTNTGTGSAANVQLTTATLGAATGSPLPQSLGTLAAGGSGVLTVTFPASAGASGAAVAEKYAGTYTGGTFTSSIRAALP